MVFTNVSGSLAALVSVRYDALWATMGGGLARGACAARERPGFTLVPVTA